jgi:hypothetical protein
MPSCSVIARASQSRIVVIEAHGGHMWAGANEPRGAVFQFTVPLERDETVPAGSTPQDPTPR